MAKLYIKSALFLLIVSFVIYKLDKYFVDDDPIYSKYNAFYDKNKGDIDILFVGDSHTANGFNTSVIDAKCNLNSYNLGVRGTNIFHAYFRLKEALNYQTPKLVVIENFTFLNIMADTTFLDSTRVLIAKNKADIYAKRMGPVKWEEIKLVYKENRVNKFFNLFRAHENWSNLKSQSRVLFKQTDEYLNNKYRDHYRSYSIKTAAQANQINEYTSNTKTIGISKDQETILREIIGLSKTKNFKLLFLTLPYYTRFYPKIKNEVENANTKLKSIIGNNQNVQLLDMNHNGFEFTRTYFQKEDGFLNNHLNYKGGIRASAMIANYIDRQYGFKERDNPNIDKEYFLYNRRILDSMDKSSPIKLNLERINGAKGNSLKIQDQGKNIELKGWAFLENLNTQSNRVYLAFIKNQDFSFIVHTEDKSRKDVTEFFKKTKGLYDNAGFEISFNSDLLENGNYDIYLIIENKGKIYLKRTGKKLNILNRQ